MLTVFKEQERKSKQLGNNIYEISKTIINQAQNVVAIYCTSAHGMSTVSQQI